MAHGRPLQAKLFLEGIEVPFIGASITHTVNQASIAYIDLVPHSSLLNIKPRTHVVLQVRDVHNVHTGGGFPYVQAWEGEVFGYNFGKSVSSRSFSISCIDYTGYWDNVLTYFFNAKHSMGKGTDTLVRTGEGIAVSKASGGVIQNVTGVSESYFKNIIDSVIKSGEGKDFLDGFVEVYKQTTNVNQFYNYAEERLKIIDRILLKSSGALSELLDAGEAMKWTSKQVDQASGMSTLRGVVQQLMSLIFHDFVSVPFPSRVEKPDINPEYGLKSSSNKLETIGNFIFKPNLYMVPPPMCNVFFPDEYSSISFNRNFFKEPTRLVYQPEMPIVLGDRRVAMPQVYEPKSFDNFMQGKEPWENYQEDTTAFNVPKFKNESDDLSDFPALSELSDSGDFPGYFEDDNPEPYKASMAKRREGQFLTNEEMLKGIWMAVEHMMPASTSFRADMKDAGKRSFSKKVAEYLFHKKRFQGRGLQITSHLKMSVVPGFNVLILDDSDAEQNMVAYCSSVTHRIYATEGGYTNVSLSYARGVEEEDASSEGSKEPLVPPWFSSHIFGSVTNITSESTAEGVDNKSQVGVFPEELSDFYKELLGEKGYKAITSYAKDINTMKDSTKKLLSDYRERKAKATSQDVQQFIAKLTSRNYVRARDTFRFLQATTNTSDLSKEDFIIFSGDEFLRKGKQDEFVVNLKRSKIEEYVNFLKKSRGFRG